MKFRRFTLTVFVFVMGLLMPLLISRMATATAMVQVAPLAEAQVAPLAEAQVARLAEADVAPLAEARVASRRSNSPVGGGHQALANATGPYIVYSRDATSIYVVPLEAGTVPDLDFLSTGQLITASPSCNPTGRPSLITLNDGYGDFLAIWTQDASTKCYSRFVHYADGTFREANLGAWDADWSASGVPADLNGDGWDDLLLTRSVSLQGNSDYEYKVAFGEFGGSFDFSAPPITIVQNVSEAHFALGDADGDGQDDLVYHSGGVLTTTLQMLPGNGNGTFGSNQFLLTAPLSSRTPVFGDFNENGRADIFLPPDDDTNDLGQAYVALYNDNGSDFTVQQSIDWRPAVENPVPDTFSASAQSCDVDLDGDLDLIARTNDIPASRYSYWVHLGDGQGQFFENGDGDGDVIDSGSNPGISLACSRASTLSLAKTVSSPTAQAGETLTYEIVLTATGEAADVVLADTLPAGLIYVTKSLTGGASYDQVTHQIHYTGPISPSTPHLIRYQATIDPDAAAGSIFNNGVLVQWEQGRKFREDAATVVIPDPGFNDTLVLIYANADNDLSQHMLDLVHRAEQAADNNNVKVLLLLDGPNKTHERDAYLYDLQKTAGCISYDPPPAASPPASCPYQLLKNVWQWDENMATAVSLSEFLIGAKKAYPNTNKVVLSIVGHGYGWAAPIVEQTPHSVNLRSPIAASQLLFAPSGEGHGVQPGGFMWDDHPRRSLSTIELGQALNKFAQATGKQIDLLYLDACTMGMEEIAYQVRDSVDYLLASPNTAWTSFRYYEMIKAITHNATGRKIGRAWLKIEADDLQGDDYPFTLSLIDLTEMDALRPVQDELADALIDALTDPANDRSEIKSKIDTAFTKSDCFDSNGDHYIVQELDSTTPDPLSVDSYCDLYAFADELRNEFGNASAVGQAAKKVKNKLRPIIKRKNNGIPWVRPNAMWDWRNFGGLSVYLPLIQDEWRRGYYNGSHLQFAADSRWDEFLAEYWNYAAPPKWYESPDCCLDAPLGPQSLAPIELQISEGLDRHALNWTPPQGLTEPVTYELSRTADRGLTYDPIATTSDTQYDDTDPTLDSGAEYCYQVTTGDNESNMVCAHAEEVGITNVTPRYGLNDVSSAIYIYGNGFTETLSLTVTLGTHPLDVNFVRLEEQPQRIRAVVRPGLTPDLYDITVETPTDAFTITNAYQVIEATEVDDLLSSEEWLWTNPTSMRVGLVNSSIGLNVQHLGGTGTIDDVAVDFRLDSPTGELLERSYTSPLKADATEGTTPITWKPMAPSDPNDDPMNYTVCAIIDPDNEVPETNEDNNVVCREIPVLPPVCLRDDPHPSCGGDPTDSEPPEVTRFVIQDDALMTEDTSVTLDVTATDYPLEGANGVNVIKYIEFEYILGARRWVAIQGNGPGNWIDYETARLDYPWELVETYGMRYMRAWAADGNRNISSEGEISLRAGADVIDLVPTTREDTVAKDDVVFYRILLEEGDSLTAEMTPTDDGNPDMYIWGPNDGLWYDTEPDPATGVEQVQFTAPDKGTYQIEIHGPSDGPANYRLEFGATHLRQQVQPNTLNREPRGVPDDPAVPLDSWPEYYDVGLPPIGEPPAEPSDYSIYLPITIR